MEPESRREVFSSTDSTPGDHEPADPMTASAAASRVSGDRPRPDAARRSNNNGEPVVHHQHNTDVFEFENDFLNSNNNGSALHHEQYQHPPPFSPDVGEHHPYQHRQFNNFNNNSRMVHGSINSQHHQSFRQQLPSSSSSHGYAAHHLPASAYSSGISRFHGGSSGQASVAGGLHSYYGSGPPPPEFQHHHHHHGRGGGGGEFGNGAWQQNTAASGGMSAGFGGSNRLTMMRRRGGGGESGDIAMQQHSSAFEGGGGSHQQVQQFGGAATTSAARNGGGELPIMAHKERILTQIREQDVTCIQGDTGCGKSTCVPLFLYEECKAVRAAQAAAAGERDVAVGSAAAGKCNIMITQPRRLACIALAKRVASQIGENVGRTVGYKISGDSLTSSSTELTFVTTGFLLQVLINQPRALEGYSHLILDEVHERGLDADLLSLVVRLHTRGDDEATGDPSPPSSNNGGRESAQFKLIVMSATLQGSLFSQYFTPLGRPPPPTIHVGVKRYPVQTIFLEDILDISRNRSIFPSPDAADAADLRLAAIDDGLASEGASGGPSDNVTGGGNQSSQVVGSGGVDVLGALLARNRNTCLRLTDEATGACRKALGEFSRSMNSSGGSRSSATASSSAGRRRIDSGQQPAQLLGKAGGGGTAGAVGTFKASRSVPALAASNPAGDGDYDGDHEAEHDIDVDEHDVSWPEDCEDPRAAQETSLQANLMPGLDAVVLDLIASLTVGGESCLIFLPGIGEITDLYETLSRLERYDDTSASQSRFAAGDVTGGEMPSGGLTGSSSSGNFGSLVFQRASDRKFRIFVLHSSIGREEQEEVFNKAPPDTVHIILASNIAESSLTLPAVRLVIDFGLRRQLISDPRRHVSALVKAWTSQASAEQRAGRTGRVFAGLCIRLFSREFYTKCMPRYDPPEMETSPLEKLYLTVKQIAEKLNEQRRDARGAEARKLSPSDLLHLTVQPPGTEALQRAIAALDNLGALTNSTESAHITALGHLMTRLPLDIHLCRLVLFGILFGVPCDAALLAASLSSQDPFSSPTQLLIKNPAEYSEALQRSTRSRAQYDAGHYSEALMLRNVTAQWLMEFADDLHHHNASRPGRRPANIKLELIKSSRKFSQVNATAAKRLVHVALTLADVVQRVMKLIVPQPGNKARRQLGTLSNILPFSGDRVDRHSAGARESPSRRHIEELFSRDYLLLKCLLAASFSPQFLIGSPRQLFKGTVDCRTGALSAVRSSAETSPSPLEEGATGTDTVMALADDTSAGGGGAKKKKKKKKSTQQQAAVAAPAKPEPLSKDEKIIQAMIDCRLDPRRTVYLNGLPIELARDKHALINSVTLMCHGVDFQIEYPPTSANLGRAAFLSFPETAFNASMNPIPLTTASSTMSDDDEDSPAVPVVDSQGGPPSSAGLPHSSSVPLFTNQPSADFASSSSSTSPFPPHPPPPHHSNHQGLFVNRMNNGGGQTGMRSSASSNSLTGAAVPPPPPSAGGGLRGSSSRAHLLSAGGPFGAGASTGGSGSSYGRNLCGRPRGREWHAQHRAKMLQPLALGPHIVPNHHVGAEELRKFAAAQRRSRKVESAFVDDEDGNAADEAGLVDFVDLPLAAQLLAMFGGGRWRYPVPLPVNIPLGGRHHQAMHQSASTPGFRASPGIEIFPPPPSAGGGAFQAFHRNHLHQQQGAPPPFLQFPQHLATHHHPHGGGGGGLGSLSRDSSAAAFNASVSPSGHHQFHQSPVPGGIGRRLGSFSTLVGLGSSELLSSGSHHDMQAAAQGGPPPAASSFFAAGLELMRPASPFSVSWDILFNADDGGATGGGNAKKKKISGVCNYRNPVGAMTVGPLTIIMNKLQRHEQAACDGGGEDGGQAEEEAASSGSSKHRRQDGLDVRDSEKDVKRHRQAACDGGGDGAVCWLQPGELYGLCVAAQGTDSQSICWVDGFTLLPTRLACILMIAFLRRGFSFDLSIFADLKNEPLITKVSFFNGKRTVNLDPKWTDDDYDDRNATTGDHLGNMNADDDSDPYHHHNARTRQLRQPHRGASSPEDGWSSTATPTTSATADDPHDDIGYSGTRRKSSDEDLEMVCEAATSICRPCLTIGDLVRINRVRKLLSEGLANATKVPTDNTKELTSSGGGGGVLLAIDSMPELTVALSEVLRCCGLKADAPTKSQVRKLAEQRARRRGEQAAAPERATAAEVGKSDRDDDQMVDNEVVKTTGTVGPTEEEKISSSLSRGWEVVDRIAEEEQASSVMEFLTEVREDSLDGAGGKLLKALKAAVWSGRAEGVSNFREARRKLKPYGGKGLLSTEAATVPGFTQSTTTATPSSWTANGKGRKDGLADGGAGKEEDVFTFFEPLNVAAVSGFVKRRRLSTLHALEAEWRRAETKRQNQLRVAQAKHHHRQQHHHHIHSPGGGRGGFGGHHIHHPHQDIAPPPGGAHYAGRGIGGVKSRRRGGRVSSTGPSASSAFYHHVDRQQQHLDNNHHHIHHHHPYHMQHHHQYPHQMHQRTSTSDPSDPPRIAPSGAGEPLQSSAAGPSPQGVSSSKDLAFLSGRFFAGYGASVTNPPSHHYHHHRHSQQKHNTHHQNRQPYYNLEVPSSSSSSSSSSSWGGDYTMQQHHDFEQHQLNPFLFGGSGGSGATPRGPAGLDGGDFVRGVVRAEDLAAAEMQHSQHFSGRQSGGAGRHQFSVEAKRERHINEQTRRIRATERHNNRPPPPPPATASAAAVGVARV